MTEFPFHEAEQLGSRIGMLIGIAVGSVGMMIVRRRSEGIWKRVLNGSVLIVVSVGAIAIALDIILLSMGPRFSGSTGMFIQGFMISFGLGSLSVIMLLLVFGAIVQILRIRRRL
jgi:hypothetical protein